MFSEELTVHSRTIDTLLAIAGIAGVAALGVFLGSVLMEERPRRPRRRRWRGARPQAERASVEELVERFARTLPDNEAEIMRRRNRQRLRDW